MRLKNIVDIKQNLLRNRKKPGKVSFATYWQEKDTKYYLKENEVFFRKDELIQNILIAYWFSKKTGLSIQIQPTVVKPEKVRTCDFIIIENRTKLDLKTFNIEKFVKNKNYFDKKLSSAYGQSDNFLFDITNSPISINKAIKDIDEVMGFNNKRFVNTIYLKCDEKLVGVYKKIGRAESQLSDMPTL